MSTNTKMSPIEVQKTLAGISYPADKQALIKQAKDKGANGEIISAFNGLPDRKYINGSDVVSELSIDSDE